LVDPNIYLVVTDKWCHLKNTGEDSSSSDSSKEKKRSSTIATAEPSTEVPTLVPLKPNRPTRPSRSGSKREVGRKPEDQVGIYATTRKSSKAPLMDPASGDRKPDKTKFGSLRGTLGSIKAKFSTDTPKKTTENKITDNVKPKDEEKDDKDAPPPLPKPLSKHRSKEEDDLVEVSASLKRAGLAKAEREAVVSIVKKKLTKAAVHIRLHFFSHKVLNTSAQFTPLDLHFPCRKSCLY
jgi:hypothetical protein